MSPSGRPFRRIVAAAATLAVALPSAGALASPAAAAEGFALTRLAGDDRYATAALIATEAFPAAETVVVASGEAGHYADALAGNYLAGRLEAPVLLTGKKALPQATADALDRMGAREVVLLGGPSAVGEAVEAALSSSYTVRRIAGDDRYGTARSIAMAADAAGVGTVADLGRTAVLARGNDYADALVAGPLAFARGLPVLITDPAVLSDATRSTLQDLDIAHVVIAGGTSAVSAQVQSEVSALNGGITVTRLQGAGRSETAAAIAGYAVDDLGFSNEQVMLTRADDFADALAGGPLGGATGTPILTTAGSGLGAAATAYLARHSATLVGARVLGGAAAVSADVAAAATSAAQGTSPAQEPSEQEPAVKEPAADELMVGSPVPLAPVAPAPAAPAAAPAPAQPAPAQQAPAQPAPAEQTPEEQPAPVEEQPAAPAPTAALTLAHADPSAPAYATRGEQVTFSTEQTAAPAGQVLVRWSIAYGGDSPSRIGNGAPPVLLTHTFLTAGPQTATLRVTDSQGAVAEAVLRLTVVDPPAARLATNPSPASGQVEDGGFSVVFDGSASTPVTGQLRSWSMEYGMNQHAAARYTTGEGAPPATLQHTYTEAGTYTATLRVTDASGATGSTSVTVTAYQASPTARLSGGRASWTDEGRPTGPFVTVAEPVSLDTTQSTPGFGNTLTSWSIAYSDGTGAAAGNGAPPQRLSHTFSTTGAHSATLTVTDSSGTSATTTHRLTAVEAPVARLSASPTPAVGDVSKGVTVTFDGSGSSVGAGRTIRHWSLHYGSRYESGSGPVASSLQHTYTSAGLHDAYLYVTDDTEATAYVALQIEVHDTNAQAVLEGGRYGYSAPGPFATVGEPTTFRGRQSRPGYGESLSSWSLDLGDGSAPLTGSGAPSSGEQHVFAAAGTYDVVLSVTDSGGSTSTATMSITVSEAPVARLATSPSPATGPITDGGLTVTFDPRGSTAAAGRTLASWSMFRECCEHRYQTGTPAELVTYTFPEGTHRVHLTVTDDTGATHSTQVTVLAYNPDPVAAVSGGRAGDGEATYATAGEAVTFYAYGSRAGYQNHLTTWALSYGDGSPELRGNGTPLAEWWMHSHTYAAPGDYTVSLTVTDSGGGTDTDSFVLTVLEPPTAALTSSVVAQTETGYTVSFHGSGSTAPAGHRIVSWTLHYGDGRTDHGTGAPGAAMLHEYAAQDGRYTAVLRVTDSAGSTATAEILVAAPQP